MSNIKLFSYFMQTDKSDWVSQKIGFEKALGFDWSLTYLL